MFRRGNKIFSLLFFLKKVVLIVILESFSFKHKPRQKKTPKDLVGFKFKKEKRKYDRTYER